MNRRRAKTVAAFAAGAVAIYLIAGFLLLPALVREELIDYVERDLGQRLTIGRVAFNPLTFHTSIRDLDLREPGGGELLRFRRLDVGFGLRSLLDRIPTFSVIALQQPSIYIELRQDGTLNYTRLIEALRPADSGDTALPRLRVGRIALLEGEIEFADLPSGKRARLELVPIALELRELSTLPSESGPYRLTARTADDEIIEWSGEGGLNPMRASGSLKLSGWKAATAARFLGRHLRVEAPSGRIDVSANYRFGYAEGALNGLVDGIQFTLDDLKLLAPGDKQPLLALGSLRLLDGKVDIGEQNVTFAGVHLDKLRVDLRDEGDSRGWRAAIAPSTPSTQAASDPAPDPLPAPPSSDAKAIPWRLVLPKIEIAAAALAVASRSTDSARDATIDQLELRASAQAQFGGGPSQLDLRDLAVTTGNVRLSQGGDVLTMQSLKLDLAAASSSVDSAIEATLHELAVQISAATAKHAQTQAALDAAHVAIKSAVVSSRTGDDTHTPRPIAASFENLRVVLDGARGQHADDTLRTARIELRAERASAATAQSAPKRDSGADVSGLRGSLSVVAVESSGIAASRPGPATLELASAVASARSVTMSGASAIENFALKLADLGIRSGDDQMRLRKAAVSARAAALGTGARSSGSAANSTPPVRATLADLAVDLAGIEGGRSGKDGGALSAATARAGAKNLALQQRALAPSGETGMDISASRLNLSLNAVEARHSAGALRLGNATIDLDQLGTRAAPAGRKPAASAFTLKGIRVAVNSAGARRSTAKTDNIEFADLAITTLSANLLLGEGLQDLNLDGASARLTRSLIRHPASGAELARISRAEVAGVALNLAGRRVQIEQAIVADGTGQAIIDARGKLDWDALIAGFAAQPARAAAARPASGNPWQVRVKSAEATNLGVTFTDQRRKPALVAGLDGVNLRAANLATQSTDPGQISISAGIRSGGRIEAAGQVNIGTLAADLKLALSDISLKPAQTFLAEFTDLEITSALASAKGRLRYGMARSAGADLVYEGGVALAKVLIEETAPRRALLAANSLSAPEVRLTLGPSKLDVTELRAVGLATKLLIAEDQTVNLARVLKSRPPAAKPASSAAAKQAATAPADFPISIARVRLEQGQLEFADLSLRPQFAARVHELAGVITGISSAPMSHSRIQLDGRVDEFGFARIRGDLNLLAPKEFADVQLTFRNLEMTALTPYSSKFAGYRIASGKLSLDLKYTLKDKRLVGQNHIVLDKLELGEKVDSPGARDLPIELAIALLKDDKGRIDIGLPVEGSLDDPKFDIGALVGKAIGNLIGGIITAPFKMLAAIFGGGAEQLERIEFDPGSARLLPPEQQKLRTLATALSKRPQLSLSVTPGIAASEDALAMQLLTLRQEVHTAMGGKLEPGEDPGPVDFSNPATQGALDKVYAERFGQPALRDRRAAFAQLRAAGAASANDKPAPDRTPMMYRNMFEHLLEAGTVSEEALKALGRQRGEAITQELVSAGGVTAARVSTAVPAPAEGNTKTAVPTTLELIVTK